MVLAAPFGSIALDNTNYSGEMLAPTRWLLCIALAHDARAKRFETEPGSLNLTAHHAYFCQILDAQERRAAKLLPH